MFPWYKGFTGTITMKTATSFVSRGTYTLEGDVLTITELPLRKWTLDYKVMLEAMMIQQTKGKGKNKTAGAAPLVKDFSENHTDETVHFTIRLTPEGVEAVNTEKKLLKVFKLETSFTTSNMNLFNEHGQITKYRNTEGVLKEFFDIRLRLYGARREHLLKVLREEHDRLFNKARFVQMVVDEELVVFKRKEAELSAELQALGFKQFASKKAQTDEDSDDEDGKQSKSRTCTISLTFVDHGLFRACCRRLQLLAQTAAAQFDCREGCSAACRA